MKRTQLVLSVLALGLAGLAQANPFPADAEAVLSMPPASYARLPAGTQSAYPADAEALITVQPRSTHLEKHAGDPVKERKQQPSIAFVALDD